MHEESGAPWHEDPQFWIALRDGIFDEARWQSAAQEVGHLLALTSLDAGAAVLDIPCGPGRHLVPLAARGLRVCGVELNRGYLEEAGRRSAEAGVTTERICADMRSFVRPASFDLAINLYTSFGYSADPQDDRQMLRNLHRSLRPGGRLVLELLTRETAVADGPFTHDLGQGLQIVEQACLLQDGAVIQRRWQLQGPELERSWTAWHRLFTVAELCALLAEAGFGAIEVHGGLDRRPFTPSGDGGVFVALA